MALKQELEEFLKGHGKIAILGIGNELKGDDVIGPCTAVKLEALFREDNDVAVYNGGTVPENYTGIIRKENPTHIILIDAVEMNQDPGYIRVVQKDEIAQYNLSTHAMPVSFLIKFMEATIDADIILVGVQPESMELIEKVSVEVKKSINTVVNTIFEVITS